MKTNRTLLSSPSTGVQAGFSFPVELPASPTPCAVAEVYQTASTLLAAGSWGCETTTASSKYAGSVNTNSVGVITVTTQHEPSARGDP